MKIQEEQKKRAQQQKSKKVQSKRQAITEGKADLGDVDVGTDSEEETQINTDIKGEGKEMNVNDEKVKDRWSRYIGAMGADAVAK